MVGPKFLVLSQDVLDCGPPIKHLLAAQWLFLTCPPWHTEKEAEQMWMPTLCLSWG